MTLKSIIILLTFITIVSSSCSSIHSEPQSFRHFTSPKGDTQIEEHIYKTVDGKDLVLLVCKPKNWAQGQKRSAAIWVHGGGWTGGHPKAFAPHMRYMASRGAVSFGIQYRLMKSGNYRNNKKMSDEENAQNRQAAKKAFLEGPSLSELIKDCADAVDYIRDHADEFGIDPQRLFAIGDSAGAHLASCLGTVVSDSSKVNAVVACSSISDLTYKFGRDFIKPSLGFDEKSMEDDPERLKRAKAASPIFNLSNQTPPFLIINGESDWLKDEPFRFKKALAGADIDVSYLSYPNFRHAFIVYGYSATIEQITQTLLDIDDFLVTKGFLKGKSHLIQPMDLKHDELKIILKEANESHSIKRKDDFPAFMKLSFEVHLPKTFKGTLVELKDKYGFKWDVHHRGIDFRALRMRKREKFSAFLPNEWNKIELQLGPKTVTMIINGHLIEGENPIGQSFLGTELVFGVIPGTQFKNIVITNE
jgi:acetyl esterase/lipase